MFSPATMSASSPLAVSMTMGIDSVCGLPFSLRQTLSPSKPGSMRSRRIRSGGFDSTAARASSPEATPAT